MGWLATGSVGSAFFLWALHYSRRFLESLFMFRYSRKGVSGKANKEAFGWGSFLGALIFYSGFGCLLGWNSSKFEIEALISSKQQSLGLLIFVVGEVGNCAHHLILSQNPNRSQRPARALFRYFLRPHYAFEALSWLGFALACPSLFSWAFLAASIAGMASQF